MKPQAPRAIARLARVDSNCKFFETPTLWVQIKRTLLAAFLALPLNAIATDPSPKIDISYISGGIGLNERETFLAQANNYNLQLTFAQQKTGSYLADVHVFIKNAKGESILDTVSEGPLFYAKPPLGKYKIEALYRGKMQSRETSLAARPSHIIFYWPEVTQ